MQGFAATERAYTKGVEASDCSVALKSLCEMARQIRSHTFLKATLCHRNTSTNDDGDPISSNRLSSAGISELDASEQPKTPLFASK